MTDSQTTIMVVDDDRAMRITLSGILSAEGHEVFSAENGQEAIAMASENAIDLIFMDIRMPGLNGVETFLRIKEVQPECVVVMMTAFSVEQLVNTALSEGAYTVLYKPLAVEKVLEILEKVASASFH